MRIRIFWSLLLIFIVNLIVRLWFLTANEIAHDEPFTLFFAQGSPGEIISNLIPYNNPPLYEILLHYWIKLFGLEPFNVRLFSCLISCFGAVALFYFANKNWNNRIAWQSVIIYTFSTYQISFAHETRVYSLFFLLTVLCFHFLIRLMEERKNKFIFLYVLSASLMLYSHFFSIWVIFVQLIYLLVNKKWNDKKIILALLSIFILFLPYFKIILNRFSDSSQKGTWLEPPTTGALYENIRHFSNQPMVAVIFLVLIVSVFIYLLISKEKISHLRLLLIWFFIPYFLIFLISFKVPMFLGRYLIFLTPAFILLVAACADKIYEKTNKAKWFAFLPSLLMIVSVNLKPSNDLEPGKVAQLIKPYYEKQVMILLAPASNDIVISYHLDNDLFTYRNDYRAYERSKNYYAIDFISEVEPEDEIIYIETYGGSYLDKNRGNFSQLKEMYEFSEELTIDGNHPKGFCVFHFKTKKL